ncbi:MAG: ISAs1 family transposase, partial [Anaerolineae bacterium]|nr:ISAs1 family transposase [Anaerolineae bacterium]
CEQIVAAHGDYVFPVKRNLPTLQRAIADAFMPPPTSPGHSALPLPSASAQSIHLGRGRIEYRDVTVTSALNHYLDWPQLAQVFRLQRLVQHKRTGKLTYQVVFGVTSLSPERCSPQRLLGLIRDHWHIENRLHWVRDVTFHEDASPIRSTPCQRVLACLNNLVIGLIRQTAFAYVPEARRFFAFHPDHALALLLS